ncbi:hypothetical protein [Caulobacter endophyticus]|uniref:Uncharacterized protein n=1 Tax=Caulobacter endophyticus TaxID=2172652 RepID=A0A2T9KBJ4_9CAUL|nr:hypothetical protein [Caulobacter endophyticus]PVM93306.1 hypothetical protein DDF67_03565 [Caulobacter endophyticus]
MPEQHPNTERHGGPGASHEDRTKPRPDPTVKDRDDPDRYSRHSKVSGGGGERDMHHAHEDRLKGGPQSGDAESSKT